MILLLAVAPFLGLAAAGGSGGYVVEINDAARKLLEHAHSASLTAVIGAVNRLGSTTRHDLATEHPVHLLDLVEAQTAQRQTPEMW